MSSEPMKRRKLLPHPTTSPTSHENCISDFADDLLQSQDFILSGTRVPWEVLLEALAYLPHDFCLLDSVGMVCSGWRLLVIAGWHSLTISHANALTIPPMFYRFIKEVKIDSTQREKQRQVWKWGPTGAGEDEDAKLFNESLKMTSSELSDVLDSLCRLSRSSLRSLTFVRRYQATEFMAGFLSRCSSTPTPFVALAELNFSLSLICATSETHPTEYARLTALPPLRTLFPALRKIRRAPSFLDYSGLALSELRILLRINPDDAEPVSGAHFGTCITPMAEVLSAKGLSFETLSVSIWQQYASEKRDVLLPTKVQLQRLRDGQLTSPGLEALRDTFRTAVSSLEVTPVTLLPSGSLPGVVTLVLDSQSREGNYDLENAWVRNGVRFVSPGMMEEVRFGGATLGEEHSRKAREWPTFPNLVDLTLSSHGFDKDCIYDGDPPDTLGTHLGMFAPALRRLKVYSVVAGWPHVGPAMSPYLRRSEALDKVEVLAGEYVFVVTNDGEGKASQTVMRWGDEEAEPQRVDVAGLTGFLEMLPLWVRKVEVEVVGVSEEELVEGWKKGMIGMSQPPHPGYAVHFRRRSYEYPRPAHNFDVVEVVRTRSTPDKTVFVLRRRD